MDGLRAYERQEGSDASTLTATFVVADVPPIRMECMGGCGKHQMIRPSKIDKSVQFYGCGKCEGYLKAQKYALANRADGVHMMSMFGCIGGFHGWKMCLSTPEDEAAFARARDIRDAGIALIKARGV